MTELLDCSEYIHTGWKSDRFEMNGDESDTTQAILMCEFTLEHEDGDELNEWSDRRMPIKSYYPFPKMPSDEEIFALLALKLDTIPSWAGQPWWKKLEGLTLYPEHQKYQGVYSIADWSLRREELLALQKHKRVMHLRMSEAWLFSMSGDMFGGCIKPRYFDCNMLNDGMPGGNHRDFWALKEPTLFTKRKSA